MATSGGRYTTQTLLLHERHHPGRLSERLVRVRRRAGPLLRARDRLGGHERRHGQPVQERLRQPLGAQLAAVPVARERPRHPSASRAVRVPPLPARIRTSRPRAPTRTSRAPGPWRGCWTCYDVTVDFNAHSHNYQRNSVPPGGVPTLRERRRRREPRVDRQLHSRLQRARPVRTRLVATRPTWAAPAAPDRSPATKDRVHHFLLVSVSGTSVTVTPTDELGRTFDPITYNAPAEDADLSLTKTDSPDPVLVGQQVTYTLTVGNAGPRDATGRAGHRHAAGRNDLRLGDALAGNLLAGERHRHMPARHGRPTAQARRSRSRDGHSRPARSATRPPSRRASTTRSRATTPRPPRPPSTRPRTWPSPTRIRRIRSRWASSSPTRSESPTPARRAPPASPSPTRCRPG